MKHFKFIALLFVALLTFSSCGDNDNDLTNNSESNLKLSQLSKNLISRNQEQTDSIRYTNDDFAYSSFKYVIYPQEICDSLHDVGWSGNCVKNISFIDTINSEYMDTDYYKLGSYLTQGDSIIFTENPGGAETHFKIINSDSIKETFLNQIYIRQ